LLKDVIYDNLYRFNNGDKTYDEIKIAIINQLKNKSNDYKLELNKHQDEINKQKLIINENHKKALELHKKLVKDSKKKYSTYKDTKAKKR
jgi:hypothetical protein